MIVPLPSGARPIRAKHAQHGQRMFDSAHEKPTNGEFIALVADKMLLEKA